MYNHHFTFIDKIVFLNLLQELHTDGSCTPNVVTSSSGDVISFCCGGGRHDNAAVSDVHWLVAALRAVHA